jgi:hypothetical protein
MKLPVSQRLSDSDREPTPEVRDSCACPRGVKHSAHTLHTCGLYACTGTHVPLLGTRPVTLGPQFVVQLTLTLFTFRRLVLVKEILCFRNWFCFRHQVKVRKEAICVPVPVAEGAGIAQSV